MILPNDFAKTVEKSDKGEEKHGRRKQYEKDGYNSSWLMLVLTLVGCGNNAQVQMRTMRNTKKAMPLATRQGIMTGNSK